MRLIDFDKAAVTNVVKALPPQFHTRDVSEHQAMTQAHRPFIQDWNYHSMVGRFLSRFHAEIGVQILEDGWTKARGERWRQTSPARRTPSSLCPVTPRTSSPVGPVMELGPQCDSDSPFTARMRLHQSWYRAHVLRVPCGTGPTSKSTSRYGNMLTSEDGERGLNFLTPEIAAVVEARLAQSADRVEPFRLRCNLLSSQPMCFNLFAPLAVDHERAARLLGALFPGKIKRVLDVKLEYAPSPSSEFLADRTSFDAFVDYERTNGKRSFLAFETKLTEPFSLTHYDSLAYRRWMAGAREVWRPGSAVEEQVTAKRHNQLWRNHLLALALRDHARSPYAEGHSVVIRHPLDGDGAKTIAGYRALLRDDEPTFRELTLDAVVAGFTGAVRPDERAWLEGMQERYLAMEKSEPAWQRRGS